MLWRRGRRDDNVIDTRGKGDAGGGGGICIGSKGFNLGGVAIVVVVGLLMDQDPMQIPGSLLGQMDSPAPTTQQQAGDWAPTANDKQSEFVRSILGDTEDIWGQVFANGQARCQQPKLVLFSNRVSPTCGFASSAAGPSYCSANRRVYLDLEFFREMEQRFSTAGDFAQAYVIAHEVGHHVQNLMGISARINATRQRGTHMEGANGLSVCQELQADYFAGTWANRAQQRLGWLEPGDTEKALDTANAIGDDHPRRRSRGMVVPDPFTHDSPAQHMRWFKTGFEGDSPTSCDTFKVQTL